MGGAVGAWEEGETVGGGMRRGAGMEVSLWAEEPVACRSRTLLILIVSPKKHYYFQSTLYLLFVTRRRLLDRMRER